MNCLVGVPGMGISGGRASGPLLVGLREGSTIVAYCTSQAGQDKVLQALKTVKASRLSNRAFERFVKLSCRGGHCPTTRLK